VSDAVATPRAVRGTANGWAAATDPSPRAWGDA
jgi:hypothetical protein